VSPGRHRRLSIRITDDEYAEIATGADQFGLTATGFCAQAALDAARNPHSGTVERMEHQALGNLQADLFRARVTLNQFRADLEHTHNDTRVTADDLDKVIVRATHALADLDNAISRIHRRLGPHGSAGSAR
jgi:RNA processing factor Prp31